MAESIKGFKTKSGTVKYDFGSLENMPNLSAMAFPSPKFIKWELSELSSGLHTITKIAPANGWVRFSLYASANGDHVITTARFNEADPALLSMSQFSPDSAQSLNVFMPVSKGMIIKVEYRATSLTTSNYVFSFIYANGEDE